MELHTFTMGPDLLARADAFLRRREVRHNLLTGVAARCTTVPEDTAQRPFLATLEDGGRVHAVAVRTPPHLLLLSCVEPDVVDDVVRAVTNELRARAMVLPGVGGPRGVADVFAAQWAVASGDRARVHMAMREFELERVAPGPYAAGELRVATERDLDLVYEWVHAFITETGLPEADRVFSQREMLAERIANERFFLWWDGGEARALAGGQGTPRVGRIGPVYTPPSLRGRGYGSALTAALSQWMLDHGRWRTALSTDLANPTSNKIYQAIGYRAIGDSVMMAFDR